MRAILLLFNLILICFASQTELTGRTNTPSSPSDFYLPVITDLGLDDTLRFQLDDCAATTEVCIGIPIDSISDYQILVNGFSYVNGIAGCDYDTVNLYNYTTLFGQGNLGPYILQSWNVNGSIFSSPFNNINELVDSMNVWDPTGNWTFDAANQDITGGTPGYTYTDMVIWVIVTNSPYVMAHSEDFIANGTMLFMDAGATELIVTNSNNGLSDNAFIIASCAQPSTTTEQVFINESGTYCLDFSELPGDVNSVTNICPSVEVDFQFINGDSCVQFTGLAIGTDTACIVACDQFDVCDTTFLIVNAFPATGSQELFDTIFVGANSQWCVDQSIFMGTPSTIIDICPSNSGTFADYAIDAGNFCVDYNGISAGGTDQGCFVICDDQSNCDTTFLNVTVLRTGPALFMDTVFINQTGTFCDWDDTNLFGPITNIENGCPMSSGAEVIFDLDQTNFCIEYDGLNIGKDTACIYLTDSFGNMDTTIAIVCVVPPEPSVITDVIRLTNTPEYCIDTTQLAGNIVSIENICLESSGTEVEFVLDSVNFCVDAFPLLLGTDTACIVICDDFGVCDTTTLIVTVEEDPSMGPPQANDDADTTTINNAIVVEACSNDIIPASLDVTNFFVLPVASGGVGPNNGTAFSNTDCTISYSPIDDFCGDDQITYVICNMMGCDTATINIHVICPSAEFQVFNAFSPNGDGVNDFFKINGIDQFPDHTLYVYNRWGNEVLKATNYQNDWGGLWQGLDVPDGTYFYVFETGTGETESGYVYITR